jgi:hypothetical protein
MYTPEDDMKITSLWQFLKAVEELPKKRGSSLYYRGHSSAEYRLEPSLFRRSTCLKREHVLYKEMLRDKPRYFSEDKTTFEKLVRMQHFGLPTRLLDITANPLVALYFACIGHDGKPALQNDGEVVILSINGKLMKYNDDDAVLILSNLCKLKPAEKQFDTGLSIKQFNATKNAGKLLWEIKNEKPVFDGLLDPKLIGSVVPVKAAKNNERIQAQDGLFLLFGGGSEGGNAAVPNDWPVKTKSDQRILIDSKSKYEILHRLEEINISQKTLFPGLQTAAAHAIKN